MLQGGKTQYFLPDSEHLIQTHARIVIAAVFGEFEISVPRPHWRVTPIWANRGIATAWKTPLVDRRLLALN